MWYVVTFLMGVAIGVTFAFVWFSTHYDFASNNVYDQNEEDA